MSHAWPSRGFRLIPALVALLLALPIAPARAAGVIFVVPGGAGARTGTSWANASDLIPALISALPGDQLWVAKGTYIPAANGDRTLSFSLKSGVQIYGGFAGSETALSQRNWRTNETVLSGDLGAPGSGDNSLHVVTAESVDGTAVLDGFTISGGQADVGYDSIGGGMYSNQSSPHLEHLLFRDNTAAVDGGGMYNQGSNPTLIDVVFLQNSAEIMGGGMSNIQSNPTIVNATFSGNTSSSGRGGAIYNESSNPVLTNAVLSDNTAIGGGGMYNELQSTPLITSVTFARNRALRGGGMANEFGSNAVLSNVLFLDNVAYTDPRYQSGLGGGMFSELSDPRLSEVTFQGNSGANGGGMYSISGNPILTQVTFQANSADDKTSFAGGGGLYSADDHAILRDVVFHANSSLSGGGGIYSRVNIISLANVTFDSNTARDGGGMFAHRSVLTLTNILFQSNSASSAAGGMETVATTGVLTNVTFLRNDALYGGGMFSMGARFNEGTLDAGPTLMSATFKGNTATNGGAILNRYNSPTIINAVFSGNTATNGGAIYNDPIYNAKSRPVILNATFSGNTAAEGGAIYNDASEPTIRNCILWDNWSAGTTTIANTNNATAHVSFSIVEGDLPSGTADEGGNRSADPLFAQPISPGLPTTDGDLRLLPGSAAIDAGDNNQVRTDTDLLGNPRVVNDRVDLGAYESRGFSIAISQGNGQRAAPASPFADPLIVTVSSPLGERVQGGVVLFTAPITGASALLSSNATAIDHYGHAAVTATANEHLGTYTVSAATTGSQASVLFSLQNAASSEYLPIEIR